ncbi:hypothetical protein FRC09_003136 [Ceratobasidium sp. 395]|nr:hypothetical protein FRC09_003136 [Ceratobasidium sp. 395]
MSKSDSQAKPKRKARGADFYVDAASPNKSTSKPVPSLKQVEDRKPAGIGGRSAKKLPPPSKKPLPTKPKKDLSSSGEELDSDIEDQVPPPKSSGLKSKGLSQKKKDSPVPEPEECSDSEYEQPQDQDQSDAEDSDVFSAVGEYTVDNNHILRALSSLEAHITAGLDRFREELLAQAESSSTINRNQPRRLVPTTRAKRRYEDLDGDLEDGSEVKEKGGAAGRMEKGGKEKKVKKEPTLSKIKKRGLKGTELDHDDFLFLTDPYCQSTLHSDKEDRDQMCAVEPMWRSSTFNKVSDALRLRGEKHRPPKSKAYFKSKRVYVQANTSLPVPGGSTRIGIWAIDRAWRKQNAAAFEAAKHFINMSQKAPDVRQLLAGTLPPDRHYRKSQPTPILPVPDDIVLIGWEDKDQLESESP